MPEQQAFFPQISELAINLLRHIILAAWIPRSWLQATRKGDGWNKDCSVKYCTNKDNWDNKEFFPVAQFSFKVYFRYVTIMSLYVWIQLLVS